MLKSPQVNIRDLSKAGKIRLFEVFYDALEATRKIYLYEVQKRHYTFFQIADLLI